ncbi:MAG: ribosome biogenesis GTPase Der, partial [Rhodospirillaceae bacterium]|nr:ribosome biogenesis GTPase Der [Rhodospirillaceae bacterium]
KSTLFNRLVGKRLAIVHDTPGVTRDRRVGHARLGRLSVDIIDTAGYDDATGDDLTESMRRQTERAVDEADLSLLVVDARSGLTPLDHAFADWLRRCGRPVLLVANKTEGRMAEAGYYEAFSLGIGEPVPISAEHGEGMADLEAAIHDVLGERATEDGQKEPRDKPLHLAVVGRPNVGKSTLVNALIGEERVLTGPTPGITRDAIAVDWRWRDRAIRLVDTAGLRRRARIEDTLEQHAASSSLSAIRLAEVVVLVLDAAMVLDKQDLTIARHVEEEGRALVIAVNKWDDVADHAGTLRRLEDRLATSLPQLRGVPTVTISALHRLRLDALMDAVVGIHDVWDTRLPTGPLNRWLQGMVESHPPPAAKGRRIRLRFITQVKARPPTFAVWVSQPDQLPESYDRFLVNGLREQFGLTGVPIRLLRRTSKNPYADRASGSR